MTEPTNPPKQPAMIGSVGIAKIRERLVGNSRETRFAPSGGVGGNVAEVLETGGGHEQQRGRIGILDRRTLLAERDAPALRENAHPRFELQAVGLNLCR